MWYIFQTSVMFAVMAVSIHYDWKGKVGENSLAPAVIAVFAAWLATFLLSRALILYRLWRGHEATRQ